jgi:hypothetical protein
MREMRVAEQRYKAVLAVLADVGIFASTLWAPPQGIAQAVGIGHAGHDFQLVPFVLGLMGHLVNAVILGLIFLGISTILNVRGLALVLVGTIYGIVAYAIIYWVLLRGLLNGRCLLPLCDHSGGRE